MKRITLILLFLTLLSCGGNRDIKKELTLFSSRPVVIPTDLEVLYNGKDTIAQDAWKSSEMKLVIYTDSVSCGSCYVKKMYLWQPFIEYSKAFESKLSFCFIFTPPPKGYNSLQAALLNSHIDYPVLIDRKGDFERLNTHLPKNKDLHTFLLDQDNNVILVGNPLFNKNIEQLFYKETQVLLKN